MIHPQLAQVMVVAADATPQQYNQDGSPTGSPGFLGFVLTFILGVAIILLMLDMTRRARRLRYRNEYALAREAQERAEGRGSKDSLADADSDVETEGATSSKPARGLRSQHATQEAKPSEVSLADQTYPTHRQR